MSEAAIKNLKERFVGIYTGTIKRPGADKLLEWLEKTDFFEAPASSRFHLSCPGGLLEHSLNVYDRLRNLFFEEFCTGEENRELTAEEQESIAICSLLHDLCKVDVYKKEFRNQKTYDPEKVAKAEKWQIKNDAGGKFIWEAVETYKFQDDMPYGHGEKSVYIISGFMRLTREEAFAVRYHMGPWQEGEKRNAGDTFGKYTLALLTHMADMMATYIDETEG